MKQKQELTEKQKRFCHEYIIDLNGTQAAIRAGYSKKTAKEQASALLTKLHVIELLNSLKSKVAKKLEISRESVLAEYKKLAFFDIRTIFNDNNAMLPVKDLPSDSAAAVAGIEVDEIFEWDPDVKRKIHIGNTVKLKFSEKRAALDSICKVMGYNEPEKINNDLHVNFTETIISKKV